MILKDDDLKLMNQLNLKHPYIWIATWFGSGFMRPAPGTWGSALAVPIGLIIFSGFGLNALIAATRWLYFLIIRSLREPKTLDIEALIF